MFRAGQMNGAMFPPQFGQAGLAPAYGPGCFAPGLGAICPPRQTVGVAQYAPPNAAAYGAPGCDPWCPPWSRRQQCSDEFLNFNGRVLAPGEAFTFTARAQQPFQPIALFIPSHIAQFFEITDIRIGNDCIFQNASPMSAVVFSEVSNIQSGLCCALRWQTIYPGIDLSIAVRNIDDGSDGCPAGSHKFYATIVGSALNC